MGWRNSRSGSFLTQLPPVASTRVFGKVLGETQDQRPYLLHDRSRAIAAHIAYADATVPGGDEIDVVGAGFRQPPAI